MCCNVQATCSFVFSSGGSVVPHRNFKTLLCEDEHITLIPKTTIHVYLNCVDECMLLSL